MHESVPFRKIAQDLLGVLETILVWTIFLLALGDVADHCHKTATAVPADPTDMMLSNLMKDILTNMKAVADCPVAPIYS